MRKYNYLQILIFLSAFLLVGCYAKKDETSMAKEEKAPMMKTYSMESLLDKSLPMPDELVVDGSLSQEKAMSMVLAAQKYAAFWNTGMPEYANQALASDFMDMTLPEGRVQGKQGPIDASIAFRTTIPDLKAKIEQLNVSGDYVISRLRFTGTFTGSYGGVNGTGQMVNFIAFDTYKIEDGKIKANWHLEDNLTFMKQIGFMK